MTRPLVFAAALTALVGITSARELSCQRRPAPVPPMRGQMPYHPDTLPSPVRRDSAFWSAPVEHIRRELGIEIERILLDQRRAWQHAERKAHEQHFPNESPEPEALRTARVHCHREDLNGANRWSKYSILTMVSSGVSQMSLCPHWIPADNDPRRDPTHERTGSVVQPAQMVPFPAMLIAGLDSARSRFPRERFFTNQLIRVLTENRDMKAASRVLQTCALDAGWCAMLSGYAASVLGEESIADSLFQKGMANLPEEERCELASVELLIPASEARTYAAQDCGARRQFEDTFWWLATPLLSQPANSRRVEHYARVVRNLLVDELPLDALYDLRRDKGQDAIVAVRTRYGWAEHVWWGDDLVEIEHDNYLGLQRGPPYSAPEYALTRVSTVPTVRAVNAPFTVSDADFDLFARNGNPYAWWPQEHFNYARGAIVEFRYPQYAVLQRDDSAMFIVSGDLRGGRLDEVKGTELRANLVVSTRPDERRVVTSTVTGGQRATMVAGLTTPSIVGLEVMAGVRGFAAARTRIGIPEVRTLATLPAGGCALSQPIFVEKAMPLAGGMRALREHMLGSLALDDPRLLGLAWESYGFAAGDTVRVSVHIAEQTQASRLRALGIRLGLTTNSRRGLSISWREPDPGRMASPITTRSVPATLRGIDIDASKLQAGSYSLWIEMERKGCATASITRDFLIVR